MWFNKLKNSFFNEISSLLRKDSIIIADDGGHLTWAIHSIKVKKGQRLFSAFGNSPMGYAFPASLGASIALNKKNLVHAYGPKKKVIIMPIKKTIENLSLKNNLKILAIKRPIS